MEVKANRLGELAFDSAEAIQPQRPRSLQTHPLQPKRAHAVQPQILATAGATNTKPQPTPVSCSDTGVLSTSNSPRFLDSTKPARATNGQHAVISPSSTGSFSVFYTDRHARVQAREQTQLVDSKRTVNTGQPGLQRAPPGKANVPDCTNPRAIVAEQLPGHTPLCQPSMPIGVFTAMDYDYGAHTKQSQQQTTHTSHRLRDTLLSGTLQIACGNALNSTLGAGHFVSQTLKTWSCWTKAFSAFTSWTGATLGRGIVGCSKQY